MSHPNEQDTFKTLQFYATSSYTCSYLPDQQARSQVAAPTHLIDAQTYSRLVEQGFRRSGLFTYRPHCDNCQACKPIRVDVRNFRAARSQRRVWTRHSDLTATVQSLRWDPDHFALYQQYQQHRHPGAGMDEDSTTQYSQFLLTSRVDSRLVEFRNKEGALQMVSLIDILDNGLSAVYTFFDPLAPGSLGVYGILWQIEKCRDLSLPWLYLGYWIEDSRKMAYKSRYAPHQILDKDAWIDGADH